MSSYESMVKAMSAVKAYNLDGNTYVDKELLAYSAVLDAFSEEIDEIIRECIVTTAENEGLSFYEKLVGTLDDKADTDTRRAMIISLLNLNTNDNTHNGIKRFFESIGLECEIAENPSIFDLYIMPVSRNFTASEKRYMINRAKKFLPCHLTFTIDFRTSTWADYNAKNMMFKDIDALGITWEEFEFTDV